MVYDTGHVYLLGINVTISHLPLKYQYSTHHCQFFVEKNEKCCINFDSMVTALCHIINLDSNSKFSYITEMQISV